MFLCGDNHMLSYFVYVETTTYGAIFFSLDNHCQSYVLMCRRSLTELRFYVEMITERAQFYHVGTTTRRNFVFTVETTTEQSYISLYTFDALTEVITYSYIMAL
jgi:hypothetical protein